MSRLARRAGGVLLVAALAAGIAAAALVLSTFPRRSGSLRVRGLRAPVSIATDAHGVPAIRAKSIEDAMFGIGFAHARDRLWQMEFERRAGAGRLAEILGEDAVPADTFLRTVGFRRAAESALRAATPEVRRLLEAYAAGVNAFLAADRARPVELRILRAPPVEPWTPADSLAWGKLMEWDLSRNAEDEIRFARVAEALGPERANELFPVNAAAPTILTAEDWSPPAGASPPAPSRAFGGVPRGTWRHLGEAFALLEPLGLDGGEGTGSNSWVVSGARTESGFPMLANDPHLKLRMPPVWYLATLEAPGLAVSGATLPGIPFVLIGHNARIAWGSTSLEPDVQDLFVEKTDLAHPGLYFHRGEWKPFTSRVERIRVRNGPEVSVTVRESVHGPLVGAVMGGALSVAPEVALRWTGLDPDDRTAEAFWALDRASSWTEFLSGAALVHCAAQNFVYADLDGHIGYTSSGAMPRRPRGDGRSPVSGTGEDDWAGFVPFEDLPRVLDPARGLLVTANNRATPREPYAFGLSWAPPYRAARIAELLAAKPKLTAEDFRRIQSDGVSLLARELLPLLADTRPRDEASKQALEVLRGWDGEMAASSASAAVYAAWYVELARMPDDELEGLPQRPTRGAFLLWALRTNSAWCDDPRTPPRETCADFKSSSLSKAAAFLRGRLGPDPSHWSWGALHRLRIAHDAFDGVPILHRVFDLEAARGGDGATVNVGGFSQDGSFRMTEGSSFRQVLDLSPQGTPGLALPGGQSGNVFDRRYRDLFPLWERGELFGMGDGPVEMETLEPDSVP